MHNHCAITILGESNGFITRVMIWEQISLSTGYAKQLVGNFHEMPVFISVFPCPCAYSCGNYDSQIVEFYWINGLSFTRLSRLNFPTVYVCCNLGNRY